MPTTYVSDCRNVLYSHRYSQVRARVRPASVQHTYRWSRVRTLAGARSRDGSSTRMATHLCAPPRGRFERAWCAPCASASERAARRRAPPGMTARTGRRAARRHPRSRTMRRRRAPFPIPPPRPRPPAHPPTVAERAPRSRDARALSPPNGIRAPCLLPAHPAPSPRLPHARGGAPPARARGGGNRTAEVESNAADARNRQKSELADVPTGEYICITLRAS